jgi:hypothetical protein
MPKMGALLMTCAALGAALAREPAAAQVGMAVTIGVPPPPLRAEALPPPRRGYVWAPGYWAWNGRRHVWVSGYWVHVRHHQYYTPGRWVQGPGGWQFVQPGWVRGDGPPP